MKLNLGSANWSKEGWTSFDHDFLRPFRLPDQAWELPYDDGVFDTVFSSHMIEHISHFRIEQTLAEINRVMSKGGVLRLLTPDLEVLCRAYVERDLAKLERCSREAGSSIHDDLGPAQTLLGFLYSPGYDNVMLDSSRSRIVGCYAHVFCYDYELLSGLLKAYGFCDVKRMSIDESRIPDHKDLRTCAYDLEREHGLVVECCKDKHVPFVPDQSLLFLSDPYGATDVMTGKKYVLTRTALLISSHIENFLIWAVRLARKALRPSTTGQARLRQL